MKSRLFRMACVFVSLVAIFVADMWVNNFQTFDVAAISFLGGAVVLHFFMLEAELTRSKIFNALTWAFVALLIGVLANFLNSLAEIGATSIFLVIYTVIVRLYLGTVFKQK